MSVNLMEFVVLKVFVLDMGQWWSVARPVGLSLSGGIIVYVCVSLCYCVFLGVF